MPTDQENAEDFRKRFASMALPIVGLLQEITRKGYACNFHIRLTPENKPDIGIEISRVTKL